MSILGDRAPTAQRQCAGWFSVTIPAQIFDGSPMEGAARLEFSDALHRSADRARTDAQGRTGRQRAVSGEGASVAGLSGSGLAGTGAASHLAVGLGLGPAAGGEPKVDVRVAAGVDVRGCLDRPNAPDPCRAASVWRGIALGSVLFLSMFRSSFAQASVPKCNLQSATGDSSGSIWTVANRGQVNGVFNPSCIRRGSRERVREWHSSLGADLSRSKLPTCAQAR